MTGDEFIALAGSLVATPGLGGGAVRSSAYGHNDVYDQLWQSGHDAARELARHLSTLRTDRNRADYRVDEPKFATQAKAVQCVELAHDVMRLINTCRTDPDAMAAIAQGVQDWVKRSGR